MIKRPPNKAQIRAALDRQVQEFLDNGHAVKQIPKGVSGRDAAEPMRKPEAWHLERSSGERTYVNHVVETLEQRRHATPAKKETQPRQTKKKLIYDDFGEPLRWIWSDS